MDEAGSNTPLSPQILPIVPSLAPSQILPNDPRQIPPPHLPPSQNYKQQRIIRWTNHRPFVPGIPLDLAKSTESNPRTTTTQHLILFGTAIPSIDPTKVLHICMQNTQHSFKISGETLPTQQIISNLQLHGINIFAAISPDVNWCNYSNWNRTKLLYKRHSPHIHLSAVSSDIGYDHHYLHSPHLIGGSTILTFGIWASKVILVSHDPSGYGIYTATTLLGKNNKKTNFY